MKLLMVLLIAAVSGSFANAAPDFPFAVTRDPSGRVDRIELVQQASLGDGTDQENLLTSLRNQIASPQSFSDFATENSLSRDEQKIYNRAKDLILQNLSLTELNNPLLDQEFTSAVPKLNAIKVYRLLASPNQMGAFDQENSIKEVVQQVLAQAKQRLQGNAFEIFEFLVTETLESLESRREFHQNRLLYWMDQPAAQFTDEERNLIRSSIFYSRLGMMDIINRTRAKNSWQSYGKSEFDSITKKCAGFGDAQGFGICFKVSNNQILNGLVKKSSLTKSPSVDFDFNKPTRIRNTRITLMLLKLALRFVPGPDFAKNGVRSWLESQYVAQRRSEGLLYEAARFQSQSDIAAGILMSSANPLIVPNQL